MRKLVFIAIVCASVAVPALAAPHGAFSDYGRMYYGRIDGYYAGQGGEFTLWKDGKGLYGVEDWLSNSAYDIKTKAQGTTGATSFQTFCVEGGEYVTQPMDFWVSEQNAALTGAGSHAWKGGTGVGDDLDPRTAYLYTKFAQGTLAGYNYTPGAALRAASAGALQQAIWFIEGEAGGFSNSFVTLADTAVASGGEWYGKGIGDVRILQSYTTGGGLAQDQLYLVPVPAAVLLGMLGLSVAGLKLRKYA